MQLPQNCNFLILEHISPLIAMMISPNKMNLQFGSLGMQIHQMKIFGPALLDGQLVHRQKNLPHFQKGWFKDFHAQEAHSLKLAIDIAGSFYLSRSSFP